MAVYTHLTAGEIARFLARFDVGALRSAKGIAEGVSNSNWLIETERDGAARRFILTVFEARTEAAYRPEARQWACWGLAGISLISSPAPAREGRRGKRP